MKSSLMTILGVVTVVALAVVLVLQLLECKAFHII